MNLETALVALVFALVGLVGQIALFVKIAADAKKAELHRYDIQNELHKVKFLAENGKTVVKVIPLQIPAIEPVQHELKENESV